jgi:hypothetical protein
MQHHAETNRQIYRDIVAKHEAGKIIGRGSGTVVYYARKGKLSCVRIGNRGIRLFLRSECEKLRTELDAKAKTNKIMATI